MWTIQLLGGLAARNERREVTRFRTQKSASLMAYLAYHSAAHNREELIGLLWPDADIKAGRHNLCNALSFLRHVLEPPNVPQGTVILANRFTVQFNPHAVTTDIVAFESAIHKAGLKGLTTVERLSQLEQASDLYQGPLLPGFYEEWIPPQVLRLESLFVQTVAKLIPGLLRAGRPEYALTHAHRAVLADPLSDEATLMLMQTLCALDRPSQALRAYQAFAKRVKDQLDTEPSHALQNIARGLPKTGSQGTSSGEHDSDSGDEEIFKRPVARLLCGGSKEPVADANDGSATPGRLVGGEFLLRTTTRFFGREEEMAQLSEIFSAPRTRLVTLTGSGGTGKTRLAIEAAAQMVEMTVPNRVGFAPTLAVFVPLADVKEPGCLFDITLRSLVNLPASDQDPLDQLAQALDSQPNTLLVLDNVEHLADEGAICVAELLAKAADVRILVTSRKKLHIEGENEFRLGPLRSSAGEQTVEALLSVPSIALFVDRSQAALSDFQLTARNAAVVSQLCDYLEGIPLSIELAAARVTVLSPARILEQVQANRLDFLTNRRRNAASRQRTLRATLDWSYHLLPRSAQSALSALALFRKGWTLAAAQAVCQISEAETLELLTLLRDSSMIGVVEKEDEVRFTMLEAIQAYALEQLELVGKHGEAKRRHRDYFLQLAEEAECHLTSADQHEWLVHLESEHENLRAALAWSLNSGIADDGEREETQPPSQIPLRFCSALQRFWYTRAHVSEGRTWCRSALDAEGAQLRTTERAKVLNAAGMLIWMQSDYVSSRACFEESLEIQREIGDRSGIAASLNSLGNVSQARGDYVAATAYHHESLEIQREIGKQSGIATSLNNLGNAARGLGDDAAAQAYHGESLSIRREIGDRLGIAMSLNNLGLVALNRGDYTTAQASYTESLAIQRDIGDLQGIPNPLSNLGGLASIQGDHISAQAYHEESLKIRREIQDREGIATSLNNLGNVALQCGHPFEAQAHYKESLAICVEIGHRSGIATALHNLGGLAFDQGDRVAARAYYEESLAIHREIEDQQGIVSSLDAIAVLVASEAIAIADHLDTGEPLSRTQVGLRRAAHLWGAAQFLREQIGVTLPPSVRVEYDRQVSEARAALDEDAFAIAWEAGRAMTWEHAVDCALEDASVLSTGDSVRAESLHTLVAGKE